MDNLHPVSDTKLINRNCESAALSFRLASLPAPPERLGLSYQPFGYTANYGKE